MSRPRVRTLLILMNLSVLLLPAAGIALLRLYDNALIRQTEAELITQGAYIAAIYTHHLNQSGTPLLKYDLVDSKSELMERWRPQLASLDLSTTTLLPKPADPQPGKINADPIAIDIGRQITPILKTAQITTLSGIRIVDRQGIIVATTRNQLDYSLANRVEIQKALQGEWVSLLRERISDEPTPSLTSIRRGSGIRVFVALPIVLEQRLVAAVLLSRTPYRVAKALYEKRHSILLVILVVVCVVIGLSFLGALTISRPITTVVEQTQRAARGERATAEPLPSLVPWEIEQLSTAVASMAETIEHRSQYIRSFSAHVSHEFKTPLTAMRGAIELMQDYSDSITEAERIKFQNNMLHDIHRLQDLVTAMFQLAKADVMKMGHTRISVLATMQPIVAEYSRKGCDVQLLKFDSAYDDLVAMDATAFRTVIVHLLENAMRYAEKSPIKVILQSFTTTAVFLIIADEGPGISHRHVQQIFEPFFTTGREIGGTGLGLNIVKSIMTAHHGEIELTPSEKGARFLLTFSKVT